MNILVRAVIFLHIYYEFSHKLIQTCFLFKYVSICNFSETHKIPRVVSYGFARKPSNKALSSETYSPLIKPAGSSRR
jgi:hypothetical protein